MNVKVRRFELIILEIIINPVEATAILYHSKFGDFL